MNLAVLALGICRGANWAWIPAAVIAIMYILTIYRGKVRQDLADLYFPHLHRALRSAKRFDIWFQPFISLIHGAIVWSAGFGWHVTWRGISYRLASGGKVLSSWRNDDPAVLPMPCAADELDSRRNFPQYRKTA